MTAQLTPRILSNCVFRRGMLTPRFKPLHFTESWNHSRRSTLCLLLTSWFARAVVPCPRSPRTLLCSTTPRSAACEPASSPRAPRSRTRLFVRLPVFALSTASKLLLTSRVRATTCRSTPSCSSAAVVSVTSLVSVITSSVAPTTLLRSRTVCRPVPSTVLSAPRPNKPDNVLILSPCAA